MALSSYQVKGNQMKKFLLATSALALAGSGAYAEITVSGTAELGIDYNSEAAVTTSKHKFVHEVGIDFTVSGTTDGGLSFGGSAGFDTNDDVVNLGTSSCRRRIRQADNRRQRRS